MQHFWLQNTQFALFISNSFIVISGGREEVWSEGES
jgi:hypothetical protein